jgi:hypothetical protein
MRISETCKIIVRIFFWIVEIIPVINISRPDSLKTGSVESFCEKAVPITRMLATNEINFFMLVIF